MSFFANILQTLGVSAATVGTQGCWALFMDKTKMPKSLIKQVIIKKIVCDLIQAIFLYLLFE